MTTRDELAREIQRTAGFDEHDDLTLTRVQADAILDAILPQVTTVEELEALPPCILRTEPDGYAWPQMLSWRDGELCYGNHGESANARVILRAGPLTVVWRP